MYWAGKNFFPTKTQGGGLPDTYVQSTYVQ